MSHRFKITDSPLAGLKIIQRIPIEDSRGFLERLFCTQEMEQLLQGKSILQINHTLTGKSGTARGLHFQYPPNAEKKIVTCIRG